MKRLFKIQFSLSVIISLFLFHSEIRGQEKKFKLLKPGAFLSFYEAKCTGFSLSLELESSFKSQFFSHGPRLDYTRIYPIPEKYFLGRENLLVGYQVKYYPLQTNKKRQYHGPFIGGYPFYNMPVFPIHRNGPGLGTVIGYQHVFRDKYSLSFEASILYFQNMNESVPRKNPADRYFFFNATLKFGIRL